MNFSLEYESKLTKDIILSKISEEQIFAYYIGTHIKSKKLFCSRLRNDKNPTCSLYKNKSGNLIYKDFATNQSLNVFGYVMELFHCTYPEALKIIANDFGIKKDSSLKKNKGKVISKDFKIEEKEFSKIQVEIQDFTELELKWWAKYGITKELLEEYNIYSCKHVFLNDQLIAKSQQHCPIFGYYGGILKQDGNKFELWRIYYPKNKSCKFMGNWSTKMIQGYSQLPDKGNLLVITKSMKDVLTLKSLGISACAPNSESQFISDKVLNGLRNRFKHIIVLFDLDHAGIQFSKKIKKEHPDLVVTLLPRTDGCKDISDYYKKYGRRKTSEMIKRKLLLFKNNLNE